MTICQYSKVQKWNDEDVLGEAFSEGIDNFFVHVYIPIQKRNSTTHMIIEDEWEMTDIGLSDSQIAQIYNTYYGQNYLIEKLIKRQDDAYDYETSYKNLGKRIQSVFLLNKQKYLKLLDLQGYVYNPLWNVDGTDEFTYLENQGINDVTNTAKIGNVYEYTNTYDGSLRASTKTQYGSFDGNDQEQSGTGGGISDTDNVNQKTKTTYKHNNAKNLTENNNEEDYTATSTWDQDIKGGDKFHTEKRVRTGNIGVTKTQELIASERENLRFTIIQEFFDDINKQILIGIFDN